MVGGFPDNSVGKESARNAEDPDSIPEFGRFTGEGIGYSLQYSWTSLVTQLVKNPPARDFPGGPVVRTSPSSAEGAGLIPTRGVKIPHALGPKNQNIRIRLQCGRSGFSP